MKIKPQIYAKTLVESAKSDNLKQIARNFWLNLQKNKQYRDLKKIVELMDEESARAENKILARVYSKNLLAQTELDLIKEKIEKKIEKQVFIKNEIGKNITGFVVKIDDKILDLSLENKVNKLKRLFAK